MTTMVSTRTGDLLRFALRLDAVLSGVTGVAYLIASGPLARLLGLSAPLLLGVGVFLVVWAAALWRIAAGNPISRTATLVVIVLNVIWALDSVVALAAGWFSTTTAGTVWVLLQALVVVGFAELQYVGLRRRGSPGQA